MKILGIPVWATSPKADLLKHWVDERSLCYNGLPSKRKRQLVLLFLILSNLLFGCFLLSGLMEDNAIVLEVPAWEPPVIFHDSILNTTLNQLFYETIE